MKRRGSRILVPGEAQARGGLILPGEAARQGVPELLVPRGYESGPRVLVGKCLVCDATFHRGEEDEWQRHVGRCARQALPELMDARAEERKRLAVFDEENWNPDVAEHLRKVGKRMLAEGRMVLKPNERVENE